MRNLGFLTLTSFGICTITIAEAKNNKIDKDSQYPNIIMLMADDLGWGDVGFNGNNIIKTPSLDRLAANGVTLERFYSAAPVSSPTRGSCITGRNPFRYGIYFANVGFMKKQEVTIAEVMRTYGYKTGHFGKWHLGTVSDSLPDGRRGGSNNLSLYSPPWENGFDVCFSTEQAVPTWNPMEQNGLYQSQSRYWTSHRKFETNNLEGDDSRVIMDRVLPFIDDAKRDKQPFLAVVWFHTPHSPVVAGDEYKRLYSKFDDNKQHYYGCITAMDEQIGRLQDELERLGLSDNTIITFCSDNGPAGAGGGTKQIAGERQQGSTGEFRGRKGSLYEGGIRVPACISWQGTLSKGSKVDFPMFTSDYFTSILSLLNIKLPVIPYDGIDFFPALQGKVKERDGYIGFLSNNRAAVISQRYKLLINGLGKNNSGNNDPSKVTFELYDLITDKSETQNIASQHPDVVKKMNDYFQQWSKSCRNSDKGGDYEK